SRGRRGARHARCHSPDDEEADVLPLEARVRECRATRGKRHIGERLLVRDHSPLTDAGALTNPLVRGVDVAAQVVVRDDSVRNVAPEPRDRDLEPRLGGPDHSPTKTVNIASAASSSPTDARP